MRHLYPYQRQVLAQLLRTPKAGVFLEMRLGKTLIIIRVGKIKKWKRVLVVGPNSALSAWEDELSHEGIHYIDLRGTKEKRSEAFRIGGEAWYIINKEGFGPLPEIANGKWDAVILDESSAFLRNPKSKVTKFFTRNFQSVKYKYILTGTPAPNHLLDYYCQFKFLFGHFLKFQNYWGFRKQLFKEVGFQFIEKGGVRAAIESEVSRNSIVLRRKDLDLEPTKVREFRSFTLPNDIKKQYNKLDKEFAIEIDGKEIEYMWFGQRYNAMRRLCSGLLPTEELVSLVKIKELMYLISSGGELENEKIVVWFKYRTSIKVVQQHLQENNISSECIHGDINIKQRYYSAKRFNEEDSPRILLCQVQTAQAGINLARADTAIYYEAPTGVQAYQQSQDRIVSIKKRYPLLYIFLAPEDTIELDLVKTLMYKSVSNDRELDRILRESYLCRKNLYGIAG